MKKFYSFVVTLFAIIVIITTVIFPQKALANTAASSAVFVTPTELETNEDAAHIKILHDFLVKRNSPLAPYAKTFVDEANKNNLDWRLVAAISGLESSFGVHIPSNSYNGWGYGIYGNNVRRFGSWDEGIAVVSAGIRNDYMNKWNAKTIPEIGRIYAASPTWAVRVQYFMNAMDDFKNDQDRNTLALSL